MIKVIHYINQFYAGIGGEEVADYKPEVREEPVGPGTKLNSLFKGEAEIVATIICGDSYFNENIDEAKDTILEMIKKYDADLFVAGPAFNAGRYGGVACGTIAKEVEEKLNIRVLTAMYEENPGVDLYKKSLYIVKTKKSAVGMRKALPAMAKLALKIGKGEELGLPEEEGYIERGIRKNYFSNERGSKRQ